MARRLIVVARRLARLAVIAAGCALCFGGTAHSAGQTLIGTYYEAFADIRNCNDLATCSVTFGAIPAGKVVKFEHASCNANSVSPLRAAELVISASNGTVLKTSSATITEYPATLGGVWSRISVDAPLVAGPGRIPSLKVLLSGASGISLSACTISGTVISG